MAPRALAAAVALGLAFAGWRLTRGNGAGASAAIAPRAAVSPTPLVEAPVATATAIAATSTIGEPVDDPEAEENAAALAAEVPAEIPPRVTLEEHAIHPRETLYDALVAEGFSREQVAELVKAAKPFSNLSRVRPGSTFSVWREADVSGFGVPTLASFQMALAPNRILMARPSADGSFAAEVKEIPYETKLASYTGTVESTLWEAAVHAKMDPDLIASLADVFAFDVDFNTEVRRGDRFRLVVEQKFLDGRPAGYGDIIAAEYVNQGDSHQALRFETSAGDADYFAATGNSLRRMFLRSPLKYRRISSRFSSSRFHPVLHENRAHQGVDYAADVGTPIRAVGDGLVERAGWNGGSGNFVKLRHNSTYETSYSHLSRYGAGVKEGTRVRQGQIIGYVGQTGLATGPHLHFAFYEHGVYVDPLSKRFPAADPIPAGDKARFEEAKAKVLPMLPAWPEDAPSSKVAGMPVHPAVIQPPL